MRHYIDPHDAIRPHRLPTLEVSEFAEGEIEHEHTDEDDDASEAGYYYAISIPGCLPDSEWFGPFDTEAEAVWNAREEMQPEEDTGDGSADTPYVVDEWSMLASRGDIGAYHFTFGAYGSTHMLVRAQGLDSALEAAMDRLSEVAPGHFVEGFCDQCNNAEGCDDCTDGIVHDVTIAGHTTYPDIELSMPALVSHEWHVGDCDDAARALYFCEV